jgi:hypothetical protein
MQTFTKLFSVKGYNRISEKNQAIRIFVAIGRERKGSQPQACPIV